jgi:hypothetical protein
MRPNTSSKAIPDTNPGTRRAWEPPAITKLAIGTETKSARESGRSDGQPKSAHPEPPATPATKLGFSFEMAFPLSARIDS